VFLSPLRASGASERESICELDWVQHQHPHRLSL
jgi:hypothetical protein